MPVEVAVAPMLPVGAEAEVPAEVAEVDPIKLCEFNTRPVGGRVIFQEQEAAGKVAVEVQEVEPTVLPVEQPMQGIAFQSTTVTLRGAGRR